MTQRVTLKDTMRPDGPAVYYTEAFRNVLEQHIPVMMRDGKLYPVSVDPQIAYQYQYDFTALLMHFAVPAHLQWIAMRVNNLTAPNEFTADMLVIYIPDVTYIEQLKAMHTTMDVGV